MSERAKKTIGLCIKAGDERILKLADEVAKWLIQRQYSVLCDRNQSGEHGPITSLAMMAKSVDLLVVLGGDGLLLHASRRFIDSNIPILGINLGRLGFLTDTPVGSMFDVMTEVLAGHYKVKSHIALKAECWRGEEKVCETTAVNDVVLNRLDHPRPIEFEVHIREQLMFRLRADGLIIATPAGSTAYALSAGGPIVHPEVKAISVVPLCPHSLSNRPVVVPDNDQIEIRLLDSPHSSALNYDGQLLCKLETGDVVRIYKQGRVDFIYLQDRHYYKTLRTKLHWAGHEE